MADSNDDDICLIGVATLVASTSRCPEKHSINSAVEIQVYDRLEYERPASQGWINFDSGNKRLEYSGSLRIQIQKCTHRCRFKRKSSKNVSAQPLLRALPFSLPAKTVEIRSFWVMFSMDVGIAHQYISNLILCCHLIWKRFLFIVNISAVTSGGFSVQVQIEYKSLSSKKSVMMI